MEQRKFLTVFAVFDDKTQQELKKLQNKIINTNNSQGKQTMDIPFHISLGSFPTSEESNLQSKVLEVCNTNQGFEISLSKIGFFGDKVVFAEPIVNEELIKLHSLFDNNYADGFSWHAHSTLFIDDNEDNVKLAKKVAIENFKPINAKIVGIQLGEFFPTRMIIEKDFEMSL